MFMLDDTFNDFILTKTNIKIPISGNIYSFNEANEFDWRDNTRNFIKDLKLEKPSKTSRYFGALVADTHNILLNGGIFGYPLTIKNPNGKLRLLYEAIPIAKIIEDAGGIATNGCNRILDIKIEKIHQRTPLFFGSKEQMNLLEKY